MTSISRSRVFCVLPCIVCFCKPRHIQICFYRTVRPHCPRDNIPIDRLSRLRLGHFAHIHQILHIGVVTGDLHRLSVSDQIHPAVSHIDGKKYAAKSKRSHQSSSHPPQIVLLTGAGKYGVIRQIHCFCQSVFYRTLILIGQGLPRAKGLGKRTHRFPKYTACKAAGDPAACRTAHAVTDHCQLHSIVKTVTHKTVLVDSSLPSHVCTAAAQHTRPSLRCKSLCLFTIAIALLYMKRMFL